MTTIDEKRVYDDRRGSTTVLVAAGIGVVTVEVSGNRVGEYGVEYRCTARDVASAGGRIAVATDEDVLLDGEPTGFGAAVAIGFHDGIPIAADEAGRVAVRDDGWSTVGETAGVRAVDGPLVAAADGVHQVREGLRHAGLSDVRDVAGSGVPLAATGDGLHALGNGWMDALDGAFDVVSAADGRAHAVGEGGVYARRGGEWERIDPPTDESLVDVGYTPEATAAVTAAGTLLLDGGDGWRTRSLGVRGVRALAVERARRGAE